MTSPVKQSLSSHIKHGQLAAALIYKTYSQGQTLNFHGHCSAIKPALYLKLSKSHGEIHPGGDLV